MKSRQMEQLRINAGNGNKRLLRAVYTDRRSAVALLLLLELGCQQTCYLELALVLPVISGIASTNGISRQPVLQLNDDVLLVFVHPTRHPVTRYARNFYSTYSFASLLIDTK